MTLLKIARMGHPVLRRPAEEVNPEKIATPGLQQIIDDMLETMEDADGVGLAGPQVHVPLRMFIASVAADNPRYDLMEEEDVPPMVFINPQLTALDDELVNGVEACLSIPGLSGIVPRFNKVRVDALNREGKPFAIEAEGFFARVLQHEHDHLDGVLFLDRMPDLLLLGFNQEFERYVLGALIDEAAKENGEPEGD